MHAPTSLVETARNAFTCLLLSPGWRKSAPPPPSALVENHGFCNYSAMVTSRKLNTDQILLTELQTFNTVNDSILSFLVIFTFWPLVQSGVMHCRQMSCLECPVSFPCLSWHLQKKIIKEREEHKFFKTFVEVWLIDNVVFISAAQESDDESVTEVLIYNWRIYTFFFFLRSS